MSAALLALAATLLAAPALAQTPAPEGSWTAPPTTIQTPFVRLPGMLTAECKRDSKGPYLAVSVTRRPGDQRTTEFPGEVVIDGKDDGWGLHLIDMNVAMGNLVALVGSQSQAYVARKPSGE